MLNNMEDILSRQISGFHQYMLSEPAHVTYVSRNLCDMTGCTENELLHESRDLYALLVHPADREKYAAFIRKLSDGEQTLTEEYRLVRKDGTVLCVRDTFSTRKLEDGTLTGTSVLTDISDLKRENSDLQFLNETIPCGFMKYTCEKQPRVTYINQKMIDILRCPSVREGELDYLEMYKGNIFLMVPMEERRRFSKYLNRVYSADAPIAGEITLLRCDGTRAYVFGWVTKTVNEEGAEEFQSVCMDITARHQIRKDAETKRYMKALTDVYDKIFEFNLDSNTVKCLHCNDGSSYKVFEDIPMLIDETLDKWIPDAVAPESRDSLRGFFRDFCQKKLYEPDAKPPQITYKAVSSSGELKQYSGVFIKVDDSVSYYCCRRIQETGKESILQTENDELKQKMKDLVMQFSDGIAAFEISAEGLVKPLYASDNVQERTFRCNFNLRSQKYSNRETYYLIIADERYVMLYQVEDTEKDGRKNLPENRTVQIRTFGYFDVFVGEKPVAFRNKKSKELLALLVDRRGGYVTSEEAIGFLWEDEPANTVTMSRYRKVALRLKNTLEEYGISDIVESVDGKRRIVMEKVQCDLYQYCSGKEEYAGLFRGSYLTNYSWGETTLGELTNNLE